jgi:hypothetical protein
MLKKISLAIAMIIVVFAIVIALQPADYQVTRVATMAAPPSAVFEQVNDFHKWQAWSPWAKMDPEAEVSYEGPSAGEGAVFRWSGNGDVGSGSMTITESKPHERIRLRLDFIEPMAGTADTDFKFKPMGENGDTTEMTWTMSGKNNFIGRAICMFVSMDKMVGQNFEDGMAGIKEIVERN